jgi:hypothetical protein
LRPHTQQLGSRVTADQLFGIYRGERALGRNARDAALRLNNPASRFILILLHCRCSTSSELMLGKLKAAARKSNGDWRVALWAYSPSPDISGSADPRWP